MRSQWTDERNSLSEESVQALVSIKANADLKCTKAYEDFVSDKNLLAAVMSTDKYIKK